MRFLPLFAAIVLVSLPYASAAPERGVSLSGPSSVTLDGAARLPLLVTLTLENVLCERDVEVPVDLSLRSEGARAVLADERLMFQVGSHSTLARAWSSDARTHVIVAPREALGSVLVTASYQLPPECHALGGATSGEATHAIRVEQGAAGGPVLPTIGVLEASSARDGAPAGLQLAVAGTAIAGIFVIVKRLRARQPA